MNENMVEILLVEDNPTDVELTLRAFKKNNITNSVKVVKDGAAALDFLFAQGEYADRDINHFPRVILLDLKLPKIDGLEVLRRIKADERTKLIPVVVLTSSQEEQDLMESYKLGVNSYITKPVDFDNFSKAVAALGYYWALLNRPPR
jgi:CheY-like chemotaxis protein